MTTKQLAEWNRRISVRAQKAYKQLPTKEWTTDLGDFFPTSLGDFEVYVEAAVEEAKIPAHIVVRRLGKQSPPSWEAAVPCRYWTIPFHQEEELIALWKDVTVPTCVKNCVERLHSQHRRLAI